MLNWRQVITKDIKANAMTQEQKEKLEKAAWEHVKGFTGGGPVDIEIRQARAAFRFKCGAQTILENPQEWGLMPISNDREWGSTVNRIIEENRKYREALEDVIIRLEEDKRFSALSIAKEALKQEKMK